MSSFKVNNSALCLKLLAILSLVFMSGCIFDEQYYGMDRYVYTNIQISDECIRKAAQSIKDPVEFKSVDASTVPQLSTSNPNKIITRYFFSRKYEYVMLDLCQGNSPSFILSFGGVEGASPNKRHLKRNRQLLEDVIQSIMQNCGVGADQFKIKQDCHNIPCN